MKTQNAIDNDRIGSFCRKWKIVEFYLLGSVLRDDFGHESDVDICVRFEDCTTWSLWDIAEMREELTDLFDRSVDIVEVDAIRNPFRRHEIESTRRLVYAETERGSSRPIQLKV